MGEFTYAKGRISDSPQFIAREMKEFKEEYQDKTWEQYQQDKQLQKLMDRTTENILTALIEICGTAMAQQGIAAENYGEVLRRAAEYYGLNAQEQKELSSLATQRNRLAHHYLDLKWDAIKVYAKQSNTIRRLLQKIAGIEERKHNGRKKQ